MASEEVATEAYKEHMALDLRMEPTALMQKEEFADKNDPDPGWWCKEGLTGENVRKVAKEFCKERKLQPMRLLLAGTLPRVIFLFGMFFFPQWRSFGPQSFGHPRGAQQSSIANHQH